MGWLSIKDPEDGGAPQVFSRCVSFHIFLFCLFLYEINTFLRKSSKCVFLSQNFHIKSLQNFKKIPELGGQSEEEQEHENSVLTVKNLFTFPFTISKYSQSTVTICVWNPNAVFLNFAPGWSGGNPVRADERGARPSWSTWHDCQGTSR